ncbi:MAG: hypothetical protein WAR24_13130, partial [Candidatus Acidiferrales bacterium]
MKMGHGDAAIGVLSPWGTAGWDDRRALEIGAIHLCSMQCRDDYLVHKRKDGSTLRAESANLVAQRICDTFANDGRERKLSVSAGVAIYPRDADR